MMSIKAGKRVAGTEGWRRPDKSRHCSLPPPREANHNHTGIKVDHRGSIVVRHRSLCFAQR